MPLPQKPDPISEAENSTIVEAAAMQLGVHAAVLITAHDADRFETRIYGKNQLHRQMASMMVDAALKGLDEFVPNAAGDGVERIDMAPAARDVLAERRRQVEVCAWTPEHDDQHDGGEMAECAAVYAHFASDDTLHTVAMQMRNSGNAPDSWVWDEGWFKPKDRRRDLVRAGALILAEIERLDRAAARKAEAMAADHD